MKLKFLTLFVMALVAASMVCVSAQSTNTASPPEIKTTFDPHAQLTPEEVRDVVQLAQKCGISDVASIYTYNIAPSSRFTISVNGREEVTGRNIRYDNLRVDQPSWMGANWQPRLQAINVGKFWAGPRLTINLTTFQVTNLTLRIRLSLPLETADAMLAAIGAGKIRFADEHVREIWNSVRLTELKEMGRAGGAIDLYFTSETDRTSHIAFGCEYKDGEVVVMNARRGAA
jgi:hypothetical protein